MRFLSSGRVLLRIAGAEVSARATIPLRRGQTIQAVVDRIGDTTILRVDPPSIEQSLFKQAGIPNDAAAQAVFRALVRAGIPLEPAVLRRLRGRLKVLTGPTDHSARLLVEAHRKGLELPSTAVEALVGFNDDDSDTSSDESSSDRKNRRMKAMVALQLFNHVGTDEDDWVIVPLAFDDRNGWRGSARIHFDRKGRWQEATIRFDSGSLSHWAVVSRKGGGVSLHLDPRLQTDHQTQLRASGNLRRSLERLGFANVLFSPMPQDFDAFSTAYSPDIIRPIDEEA